ncbi:MAG: glycosyltransferase, partial [Bacteroidales bacterium]|nr:glycosyltransferase [Bacteroidales bacterium]
MPNANSNTRISIIVPMYNVESYMEECLKSLWNQDLREDEYEVIIVNDGSTDKSLDIAQEICANHPNAQIISQENKGLSMARNAGLAQAQGDSIWFVDADDWIAPGCLKSICRQMEDLDILAIAANNISEAGTTLFSYPETSPI